jgi:short-subunit dehydrogenase
VSHDWNGKTVFITGAASGIARAVATQLARAGANIGVCDRNATGAETAAAELATMGVKTAWAAADVCEADQLATAVKILEKQLGPPNGVLACAGITGTTLLDTLSPAKDRLLFEINLLGVARTLQAALPALRRATKPWFAGVSSLVALRGLPFTAAYCGSKAGVADYLEGVRPWLSKEGIGLTVIYPGYVRTPLTERGAVQPKIKLLEPEQAADYIVRALQSGKNVCQFPPSLSWGLAFLRCLPAKMYDNAMADAGKKMTHLKY